MVLAIRKAEDKLRGRISPPTMSLTQTPKRNVVLPNFYPAQLEVFEEIMHGNAKYITVNGSRQVGKSVLLIFSALVWALEFPNQIIMVVSPTDQQVAGLYQRSIESIKECNGLVKSTRSSGGQAEITLINSSRILFRSAKSVDGLRGHALDGLCCDETAFFNEEVWTKILAPSLSVKGRKVLFVSTPRGSNFFKGLYQKGIDERILPPAKRRYASFKITYKENPYANLEFINEQQAALPKEIFEQEYLGSFIDSASIFKNITELASLSRAQPVEGLECVAGIDIAMVKDYTVCIILDVKGNMLDYIRFNKLEYSEAINTLNEFLLKWQPSKILIESNNQGINFISSLNELGLYGVEAFATTASSKPLLINELIAAFNKKEVRLLNDETVVNEFMDFTYTLSQTGQLKFAASSGHDDIVMAFAFALRAKNTMNGLGFYIH